MSKEQEIVEKLLSFAFAMSENMIGLTKGNYDEKTFIKKTYEYLQKYTVDHNDQKIIKQSIERLESIDNAEPSEALKCVDKLEQVIEEITISNADLRNTLKASVSLAIIKQALLKAQEPKQYVDELKLVEKKLKALDLLMQELDCKDFADLRKYARCGYEKLNEQYLKWEDLKKSNSEEHLKVKLNNVKYELHFEKWAKYDDATRISLYLNEFCVMSIRLKTNYEKQFFNDLHLERVEE